MRPEFYLCVTRNIMLAAYVLFLIAAGAVVFWRTGSTLLAAAIQLPALLAPQITYALTTVKPEPLMLCVGMLITIGVVVYIECEFKNRNESMAVVFASALTGLGLAAKITFAPVLFVPLILIERNVSRILFLMCVVGAFYVRATIPMQYAVGRDAGETGFTAMLLNSGQYGGGNPGVVDLHAYLPALFGISALELSLTLLLLTNVALLFCTRQAWRPPQSAEMEQTRGFSKFPAYRRCLIGLAAAEACQLAMVAKHPWGGAARYLVPALGLLGLNLFATAAIIPNLHVKWRGHAHKSGLALLGCIVFVQAVRQIQFAHQLSVQTAAEAEMAATVENSFSKSDVAGWYPSSSPLYALQFGNRFASAAFSEPLYDRYPHSVFYNPWWAKFTDFRGAISDANIVLRTSEKRLFIQGPAVALDADGEPVNAEFPRGVQLEHVISTSTESLYRVVRWPVKQP